MLKSGNKKPAAPKGTGTTYKFLRGTVTRNDGAKQPGDTSSKLTEGEVVIYLAQGRIVPVDETEYRTTVAETTHRDPKPKKRGRPKKAE